MSQPRARRRRRRLFKGGGRLLRVLAVALGLGLQVLAPAIHDLFAADDSESEAQLAAIVLTSGDFDRAWEVGAERDDDITIGLTAGEADCLRSEHVMPEAERGTRHFSTEAMTVAAQAALWKDEAAATHARDLLTSSAYPPCFVAQLQRESTGSAIDLLGSGPTTADPTISHIAYTETWPDGFMETGEIYQAFKGRTQIWLYAWTPTGIDQTLAVELVHKMVARVA